MEFVRIPAGRFQMGSPPSEKDRDDNEGPAHEVRITKPFYMGKYEVTQAQWKAVMGTTVSQQREKTTLPWLLKGEGSKYPIHYVSWNEAVEFCKRLGGKFRLPTEAEWEYACRAGSQTRFYYGDDPNYSELDLHAWYEDNSNERIHPVGRKKPNARGLYDMYGNISEWCSDRYVVPNNYENAGSVNPTGPASGGMGRVRRGGSWLEEPRNCRSADRNLCGAGTDFVGFRVVFAGKVRHGKEVLEIALPENAGRVVTAQEQEREIRPRGLAIGGVVRDEAGIPIDGIEKQILPTGDWLFRKYAEGRFEACWHPPNSSARMQGYHFVARHKERNLAVGMEIEEDANALDVTLKPGVILSGQVVDGDGKGIEKARVVINLQTSNWSGGFLTWLDADAEGRFEIKALPLGYEYSLLARKLHYRPSRTEVRSEDVRDNRMDGVSIVLPRGRFSVSGVVVYADGKPVPDVWVYCTGEDQVGINSRTDADGKFKADGIFEGQVEVIANIKGSDGRWSSGGINTQAGATNVRVVLGTGGTPPPKGRACFPSETGVWVNGAVVPISKVVRGRAVGKLTRAVPAAPFGHVQQIEEHEGAFECRDILLDTGNRISVVDAHCFMLDSGKWIAAQDLRDCLRLKTIDGTVAIKSVTIRPTPYVGKVYNLKISNSERYMVGKDGVIVRDY